MSTPDSPPPRESTYWIDVEHPAEMVRLARQARILTQNIGGLFPRPLDLSALHDVLDIGCGPGEWVLAVAQAYSSMRVTGIDISATMIEFAQTLTRQPDPPDAHFQLMDATQPLHFPERAFDLVNARAISSFMKPATWPKLLEECMRILRPGGVIVLTESDVLNTTSPAFERLSDLFTQALRKASQSFAPAGRYTGVTAVLPRLLTEAGFQRQQKTAYAFDVSAGTDLHRDYFSPNYTSGLHLIQPFLFKWGVATIEEVEGLYYQMVKEIDAPEFCAIQYLLSVWGYKL